MPSDTLRAIAFVPARSGSKRIANKNLRPLGGHPLLAYAVQSAVQSGIFESVLVSTDSEDYAEVARHYGAEVPFLRPAEFAADTSPDIDWVVHALRLLLEKGREFDCFSILRPTSPFRQAETIRRAWEEFRAEVGVTSLRAVEPCSQHPGKMWVVRGKTMTPLLPFGPPGQPWHSSQKPSLPLIHVQNASLEIAWTRVPIEERTIAGNRVMPFLTNPVEGFDINDPFDWCHAEHLIATGEAQLPHISMPAFSKP